MQKCTFAVAEPNFLYLHTISAESQVYLFLTVLYDCSFLKLIVKLWMVNRLV